MPSLLPGEGIGQQGLIDGSSLLSGDWSQIGAIQDGVEYPLGNCPEGVLEVSRQELRHMGTDFPRRVDQVIQTEVGMMFTCQVQELHRRNIHFIVSDSLSDTSNYVYIGTRKGCDISTFTFSAKRERPCDGKTIEVYFWKAQTSGLFQLGSGTEYLSSPVTIHALDDEDGQYGGSTTAPLGYIYAPDPA